MCSVHLGRSGLLLVKGPGVFTSYIGDDASTKKAFDKDGYFSTGDLAQVLRFFSSFRNAVNAVV